MTKIKICGLSRPCDIDYVNYARPDYCGFIVNFPKSRRNVSPERVAELVSNLAKEIVPVGVFVNEEIKNVAHMLDEGVIAIAQLHGSEDNEYIAALRKLTDKPLIQAFRIGCKDDVERAAASSADYVLLDSGGGSGKVFNWQLIKDFPRPYFLAGGLNIENLNGAIEKFHPFAVDISSGVESDGFKDFDKIKAAVAAVRRYTE